MLPSSLSTRIRFLAFLAGVVAITRFSVCGIVDPLGWAHIGLFVFCAVRQWRLSRSQPRRDRPSQ
jgi:hypothetical protein